MKTQGFRYKYPAQIDLSMIHRNANRMFRQLGESKSSSQFPTTCQCCGRYATQESQAGCICYTISQELPFMGPAVNLFFHFNKVVVFYLLLLLIVLGIYSTVSNIASDSCLDTRLGCQSNIFIKISVVNKLLSSGNLSIQVIIILIVTVLWIFVIHFCIYRARKIQQEADCKVQSPSDYAMLVSKLSVDTTEADLRQMVSKRAKQIDKKYRQETNDLKIQEIIWPMNISEYIQAVVQDQQAFKQAIDKDQHQDYVRRQISVPNVLSGVAIVIFQRQISKDFFLQNDTITVQPTHPICQCWNNESPFKVADKQIVIQRAPQPDDILWHNLGKKIYKRRLNSFLAFMVGILCLLIVGVIQYYLTLWQVSSQGNYKTAIALFSSLLVAISNHIVKTLLIYVTKTQGSISHTKKNQSLMIKIVIFQFFNSGIFFAFANALAVDFQTQKVFFIFSYKVTVFLIINAVEPSITTFLIDFFEIPQVFKRWMHKKDWLKLTQHQCNEMYQFPDCQLPFKYAHIINTLAITFFYTPFMPLGTIISLLGLLLYYFTCKFLFRFCYSNTTIRSNDVNQQAFYWSNFAMLTLNIGQVLLYIFIRDNFSNVLTTLMQVLIFVSLGISVILIFLPVYQLNQQFFVIRQTTNGRYSQNALQFECDYLTSDPCYRGDKKTNRDVMFVKQFCKDLLLRKTSGTASTSSPFGGFMKSLMTGTQSSQRKMLSTQ